MESGQTNQSTTQVPSSTPGTQSPVSNVPKTEVRVGKNIISLNDGATPLEFIQNNLKTTPPAPSVDVNAALKAEETKRAAEVAAAKPPVTPGPTIDEQQKQTETSDPFDASNYEEAPQVSLEDSLDTELEVPNAPVAENFKKLRTKAKEQLKTLKEVQAERDILKKRVEDFDTGVVVPETVSAMEARIAELEHFESIVNLKGSKAYKEKYTKPLEEINTRIKKIASDYEIPADVINEAVGLKNEAQLNRFLENHFDAVGGLEIKGLVTKIQDINNQAAAAELEPGKSFQSLKEDHEKIELNQIAQRRSNIANKSRNAWQKSVEAIRQEGKVLELIPREGDDNFNNNVMRPIIGQAATEYGKIVKMLAEYGLEDLPDDLGIALSKMALLAHASATSITTRDQAINHANEIEENTKRTTNYVRPAIGGNHGNNAPPIPKGPQTIQQGIDSLLNKVGIK